MLVTPAILTKYNPRKDKSVTISFETNEKNVQQIMELHNLMGTYGGLVFKPEDQLTPQELKEIDDMSFEMHGKSKSNRLRDVLYILHKQEGEGDFKDYYAEKMESIINQIKGRLE